MGTSQPRLSLCMLVRDEELLLAQAIESVRDVVDEIVVVDTGSVDRTREVARGYGARLFERSWDGKFGPARNAYLEQARGEWVLVLDGDERIAAADARRLPALIRESDTVAYRFMVHNYTRSLDLLSDWQPNRGAYPEEEAFSECPGYSRFPVVRLFRRATNIRYDEFPSSHTNPLRSLQATGGIIRDSDIVIHHFQCRKGGESFVLEKQRIRLEDERRHLEQHPDDALVHLNVGRTLFALGEDEAALRHLDRAVALEDRQREARLSRAVLLYETGDYARAAGDLEVAVRQDAQFADAWIVLGMVRHALGDLAAAGNVLRTALTLRPEHPLALNSLGVVQMELGDHATAEQLFRRALSVLPDHPAARQNLADLSDRHLADSVSGQYQAPGIEIGDEGDDV